MAKKPMTMFSRIVFAHAPSHAKEPIYWRGYHFPASEGQQIEQNALARVAATEGWGKRGMANGLPIVAAIVKARLTGNDTGTGAKQRAAEARERAHQAALSRIGRGGGTSGGEGFI